MKNFSNGLAAWLAFGLGAAHWLVCALVVGGEAWDGALYFVTLPLLALGCVFVGARAPEHPWRWGMIAAGAQALGLILTAGGAGPLLPVGIGLLVIGGTVLGACARLGAYMALRVA